MSIKHKKINDINVYTISISRRSNIRHGVRSQKQITLRSTKTYSEKHLQKEETQLKEIVLRDLHSCCCTIICGTS